VSTFAGGRPPSTTALILRIIREEGWTRLYAGFGTVAVAAPARALYFAGYEFSKRQGDKLLGPNHPATAFLSGPIAQLSGSLLWVPMDVVKERLQVQKNLPKNSAAGAAATSASPAVAIAATPPTDHSSTRFRGSLHAAVTILKQEGIRGWYRGYIAHQLVWGPFNAVYFTGYETLKHQWTRFLNPTPPHTHAESSGVTFGSDGSPVQPLHPPQEVVPLPNYAFPVCGAISGCLAAAATAPIDLIKVRLQTQGLSGKYSGAFDCAIKIIRHEGALSMMQGLGARCLWLSPNIALTMTTYELIKNYMNLDS